MGGGGGGGVGDFPVIIRCFSGAFSCWHLAPGMFLTFFQFPFCAWLVSGRFVRPKYPNRTSSLDLLENTRSSRLSSRYAIFSDSLASLSGLCARVDIFVVVPLCRSSPTKKHNYCCNQVYHPFVDLGTVLYNYNSNSKCVF